VFDRRSKGISPSPSGRGEGEGEFRKPLTRRTSKRNITFLTGTRAEFGLMLPVLRAISDHPRLHLQILATGMHLDPAHGPPLSSLTTANFPPTRIIPWPPSIPPTPTQNAVHTGRAISDIAQAFHDLHTDIALIVGDRVEAFAAASAAHIANIPLAHVHGGDRAAGQVDDSLRHAITKLSHLHFPATKQSARRIHQLGEDRWRIHRVGSPGLDGLSRLPASHSTLQKQLGPLATRKFALLLLHPAHPDDDLEFRRATQILDAARQIPFPQIVIIYPNNDPGSAGILRAWQSAPARNDRRLQFHPDLPRNLFLSLLRDAAVLIGNSSSGIIEAASFGTPVLDIGPRQKGRERPKSVQPLPYTKARITSALKKIWNHAHPRRHQPRNIYCAPHTAKTIAATLATVTIDDRLLRKLIRY
jgi:UDP-hydrolysing UDP-N-acetyl-D-glucosamine 2-epimerase